MRPVRQVEAVSKQAVYAWEHVRSGTSAKDLEEVKPMRYEKARVKKHVIVRERFKDFLVFALPVLSALFLFGCSKMPPECASPETVGLLKSILSDSLKKSSGFKNVVISPDRFETTDPHTVAVDETLYTRSCKVDVSYRVSDEALALINAPLSDPRQSSVFRQFLKDNGAGAALLLLGNPDSEQPLPELVLMSIGADKVLDTARSATAGKKLEFKDLSYTVRRSEENTTAGQFIVEALIPDASQKLFSMVEMFSEYASHLPKPLPPVQSVEANGPDPNKSPEECTEYNLLHMDHPVACPATATEDEK